MIPPVGLVKLNVTLPVKVVAPNVMPAVPLVTFDPPTIDKVGLPLPIESAPNV